MKAILYVFASLLLTVIADAQQYPRLQGCSEPELLVHRIEALRHMGWSEISPEILARSWPSLEATCKDDNSNITFVSRDRVIKGELECGDVFNFDVVTKDGKRSEQLHSITFHYTAAARQQLVSLSRSILEALALPASDSEGVGKDQRQQFQWRDMTGSLMMVTDVSVQQVDGRWILFLSASQEHIHAQQ